MRKLGIIFALALLLSACGTKSLPPIVENGVVNEEARLQQEMVVKAFVERQAMVSRVAHRILKANVDACEKSEFAPGALIMERSDVWRPYRDATTYFLKLDGRPRVIAVAPESPAEKAGLKPGDVILAVNGEAVGGSSAALDKMRPGPAANLRVERQGQTMELMVMQDKVCSSPVLLFEDPAINAYALGSKIFLCIGLVKFVKNDQELAMVIGHELAHNTMKHLDAKRGNATIGAILFDLPVALLTGVNLGIGHGAGMNMNSQDFETEADYVGLYYTARAGYDIQGVADMWRRMGVEHPNNIYTATTHPTTASRFAVLEATRKQIQDKQAAGQPLIPEMKPEQ